MKLITTTEVCDMLGISKTTLYRWNHLVQDFNEFSNQERLNILLSSTKLNSRRSASDESVPDNFPRPFRIGRAYKWDYDEIEEWLNSTRVKG
ncbi:helix-turn-helix domain-containing protein [Testudinibacter sp. TR-2022]|uniref:helix-turn-helix transcriptional regulator n=1 Tax=Testudinibacter sp. TR-2022 TaxID=2585029 RepID=UPI00111B64B4|nr:helix-turn-helix domain-containing protein [Testudinibacter sp. TR-2022]TNH00110.1 helix-turn-helix domain-containing protein [Pasteurellaceae bacterium Phil31]TNH05836.1 helix-turn-helix domain-containing protein [Testudinibacter sp. TR-2022]TNH06308.1 helix-turn-helix domain-containing protein [Testudinibacter sp. TR-2022]